MKTFLLLIPVLLLFIHCGLLDPGDESLSPIEGNIIFSIEESYKSYTSVSEPEIYLQMRTEKQYPCMNYGILANTKFLDNLIKVHLYGIKIPDIGLTAIGPASTRLKLALTNGEKILRFSSSDGIEMFGITVDDSSIVINEESAQCMIPEYKTVWRTPCNSFAYICGTTEETTWIYNDFIDTLKSHINVIEFHFKDDGKKPYPDSSSGHWVDFPARFFTYKTESDFDKLKQILKDYNEQFISNYSGVGIYVINWKNKTFRSWTSGNNS